MQLLNKKVLYTCIKEGDLIKINGAVQIDSSNKISFSGNFNTLEDVYCGDFVYSETEDNKVNVSTNNVNVDLIIEASKFLLETVNALKDELTTINTNTL